MPALNVSLPDQMKDWLEQRVKDGRYATVGDYVRDLVRRDQEECEALVRALHEGEESGISRRTVAEIAAAAKAKLKNGAV